jgi:hypothetical protein
MGRVQGFSNYRYAVMTHPISSLGPDQIRERAKEALPEVLAILGLEDDERKPEESNGWSPSHVSS